jgi:hypothetical protein
MPPSNAFQQVFNPATQRTLLRIGLALAVALAVLLLVVFGLRLFKKTSTPAGNAGSGNDPGSGSDTNADGTPATLPQHLKRLADDLRESTGWSFVCNDLRCDTILAMAELPDAQLIQLGAYYKAMYENTLRGVFDSFYVSGCCFRDAGNVVDAKLKNIQERVKRLNI